MLDKSKNFNQPLCVTQKNIHRMKVKLYGFIKKLQKYWYEKEKKHLLI